MPGHHSVTRIYTLLPQWHGASAHTYVFCKYFTWTKYSLWGSKGNRKMFHQSSHKFLPPSLSWFTQAITASNTLQENMRERKVMSYIPRIKYKEITFYITLMETPKFYPRLKFFKSRLCCCFQLLSCVQLVNPWTAARPLPSPQVCCRASLGEEVQCGTC